MRNIIYTSVVAVALALQACAPVDPADIDLREANTAIVAELSPDIGKDIGGGLVMRDVRTEGDGFEVAFTVPFTSAQVETIGRAETISAFQSGFGQGFCRYQTVSAYLEAGGFANVKAYTSDNQLLTYFQMNRC